MSYPQVTFRNVHFDRSAFWGRKRSQISSVALLYQLEVLKKTGRYDAFRLKWHPVYDDEPEIWPVPKHLFWDSDVAKWIEGACYFLEETENDTVRSAVNELVEMITSAQQADGYINIHFTVVEPSKRFTNLRDHHELYNAGHLIESALAHERLYKNRKMLDPILKYVDLLSKTFGKGSDRQPGYPGHPEIELSLLRLYDRTGHPAHLGLAEFFITERGNPKGIQGEHYYDYEAKKRGEGIHEVPDYYPEHRSYWYQQAHLPLVKQATIEGHAVRAMYLLTALADLIRIQGSDLDVSYKDSLYRLWSNMVQKKMYLTGGIGVIKQWEGFSHDYHLPQASDEGGCYAETCASIGVMMLADRLLEIKRDSKVGDIMELELYNAVLTGVSCSGREWTYVNQLGSSDSDLSQRSDWFTVACCPPNVLRLLGNLGGYIYSGSDNGASQLDLSIHLFTKAVITHKVGLKTVTVSMDTTWPLDGQIEPNTAKTDITDGYLKITSDYSKAHPIFTIRFPMVPRIIRSHPFTGHEIVAVARGPVIYCAEDVDNPWVQDHFKRTIFNTSTAHMREFLQRDSSTGEEYVSIRASNAISQLDTTVYDQSGPGFEVRQGTEFKDLKSCPKTKEDLILVPYYFRANRKGRGHMRVGFLSAR
ncbi:hypothetical protein FH972_025542 [Carpinus fangiana]|uniref:Uncharacterized protein n=1 Tax=Carpinus fangiana TaxID=176857 RepID=A0A5N6L1Q7_9ROSI|nr:hypothetical protein FH972_025542 [Carpinus fangiana]